MSIASSLFSGISGLNTLGNSMSVIGDNIANINTVGFKKSRVTFQDVLSQTVATSAGTSQVGRGTTLGDITSSFTQGSLESTDNTTDLAIGGAGFFVVRDPTDENNQFFTRAGEFRFDKDGNFINPASYIVRGWQLDEDTGEDLGSITDITLKSFTSSPQATTKIIVVTNLDSDTVTNPTVLSNQWDGADSDGEYINETAYEYQSTLKVYDSLGSTHDVTIYYDMSDTASSWEYIVTCNPAEDKRAGASAANSNSGLLARGKLNFSTSSGKIDSTADSVTCELLDPATGTWTTLSNGDTNGGYFEIDAAFISDSSMSIKLDFGAHYNGSVWAVDSLTTTQFSSASTTTFQSANGYGAGDLQSVIVDTDGVITGQYSNGEVIPLYRVALAKFQNEQGLLKMGGNLFRETRTSGDAITNKPGTNGLGSIAPNSLEQSNVDIAAEFVKMITTQRGFQANSKIITVTDQMLAELIQLKTR